MTDKLTLTNKLHWQSISGYRPAYSVISTQYAELDRCLQLGGWPLGVTIELALEHDGIGELRLLMPALRERLTQNASYVVWVAPSYLPYAPALIKEGIDPHRLIAVRAKDIRHVLWATEQALLVDTCAAVFSWTGRHKLTLKQTRRLQLAAERSNAWYVQFRHDTCLASLSAARLRMQLCSEQQGTLSIIVHKQPQGGVGQQCTVSLAPHYERWQRIPIESLADRLNKKAELKKAPSTLRCLNKNA